MAPLRSHIAYLLRRFMSPDGWVTGTGRGRGRTCSTRIILRTWSVDIPTLASTWRSPSAGAGSMAGQPRFIHCRAWSASTCAHPDRKPSIITCAAASHDPCRDFDAGGIRGWPGADRLRRILVHLFNDNLRPSLTTSSQVLRYDVTNDRKRY